MKRWAKIFIAYFPVSLVACQVAVNWLSFVWPHGYTKAGFYLNTAFGVNIYYAIMLVVLTRGMKFCSISRAAAIAELAFAANFLIVKEDNAYNIWFQIIVGTIALFYTFWHYVKKFPFCNFSVGINFFSDVFKKCSCRESIERFDHKVRTTVIKNRHEKGHC